MTMVISALLFVGCDEGDTVFDDIRNNETRGAAVRTVEVTENEIQYDVPTSTLTGGGFSATVEVQDQENGNLLSELNVYIGYNDNTAAQGNSTVGDAEVLARTFTLADGTIGEFGLPRFTYTASATELQSAIGVTGADIFGGDQFTIRFEVVQLDGSTYSAGDNSGTLTGSFFSSPFEYTSTLVCAPKPTTPGVWTVNMEDSYGDGWQPTTANGGGPGLTITLSDGTVIEIGMCTPYEAPGYPCVDGPSAASTTFTVPPGLTDAAVFQWNGDFWGEMSATIVTPNGNTVASISSGTGAGPIAIDFCAD